MVASHLCVDCKNFKQLNGEDVSSQLMKAAHSKEMQREQVAPQPSLASAIVMAHLPMIKDTANSGTVPQTAPMVGAGGGSGSGSMPNIRPWPASLQLNKPTASTMSGTLPLLPRHAAKKPRVVSGVVSDAASGAVSGAVSGTITGTITAQEEPELVMAISAPMAEEVTAEKAEEVVVVTAGETAAGEAMAEAMVEGAMAAAVKAVELVKAVSVSMAASMKGEAVKAVEMVVVTAGETAGETSLPLYAASTPMPLSRQELEIVQRHCDAARALKQLHGAPDFTHQEKERLYVRVYPTRSQGPANAIPSWRR